MPNAPELTPAPSDPASALQVPLSAADRAKIRAFQIGPVRVERPFVLAPMSGVTDSAFRRLCQDASAGAVGLLVTEFISIEGLTRRNIKSALRMAFDPIAEKPLAIQIFGGEIERMVESARIVQDTGAQILDINCGCPAPKVVRKGGGAELLRRCDHLARMVEAVAAAIQIPVTVKIRSGWNEESINAVEVARRCEAAGAQAIAVHGRTRVQLYSGEADWRIVDEVAGAVRVPVIGSGDVTTPEQAVQRLLTTRAAGVMIGRAAIMNPWIFGQIDDLIAGRPMRQASPAERVRVLRLYRDLQAEKVSEQALPGRLKQVLARMTKGFPHGTLLRERAMRAQDIVEMFDWIEGFFAAVERDDVEHWAEQARRKAGASAPDAEPRQAAASATLD